MPRHLLLLVLCIVASQAWPLSHLVPALPSGRDVRRSPSSDVLLQMLPFDDAATRIEQLARTLPDGPGVIVGHGTPDSLASAYFVLSMRLWPRPVSYVACAPTPRLEQFRAPHTPPRFLWRIDLRPGDATPVRATPGPVDQQAAALCLSSQGEAPATLEGGAT